MDIQLSNEVTDIGGNYIVAAITVNKMYHFTLVNIYAPNPDDPMFFTSIDRLEDWTGPPVIIAGDWNLVIDPELDANGYRRTNHPRARSKVLEIMRQRNLIDIYRTRHLSEKRFTWRAVNPDVKQARLDFFWCLTR